MRVALISDLHGNELALAAARRRITDLGADAVVCLGDCATLGPRPREVLDVLREIADVCILGNHDEFMLDVDLIHTYTEAPIVVDAVSWCRDELTADDHAFLRGFERDRELDLGHGARLLLFHGSPRSNMEDLLAGMPAGELDTALAGRRATVMAGGHTHLQMIRQHHGDLLVNPGSVGMPIRDHAAGRAPVILDHAELAIVDSERAGVSVTLHRVPLDRAALRAQALDRAHPMREALGAQYA